MVVNKGVVLSLLLCSLFIKESLANQTFVSALRNTLLLPLKQIHDALDPLKDIRDDLSQIKSQLSPGMGQAACFDTNGRILPRDCAELYDSGYTESGTYTVYMFNAGSAIPLNVYCDMETDGGGWMVFQRRRDGSENFYRTWNAYSKGFGNISNEFWMGNELIHLFSDQKPQALRVDLGDHEGGSAYAKYSRFYVGPKSSQFTLNISSYSGNAGDSLSGHNGYKFSTRDSDNDAYEGSCAQVYKGAWWYSACHGSNLNGEYQHTGSHQNVSYADHVTWRHWHGYYYSLKFAEMKMRPSSY